MPNIRISKHFVHENRTNLIYPCYKGGTFENETFFNSKITIINLNFACTTTTTTTIESQQQNNKTNYVLVFCQHWSDSFRHWKDWPGVWRLSTITTTTKNQQQQQKSNNNSNNSNNNSNSNNNNNNNANINNTTTTRYQS